LLPTRTRGPGDGPVIDTASTTKVKTGTADSTGRPGSPSSARTRVRRPSSLDRSYDRVRSGAVHLVMWKPTVLGRFRSPSFGGRRDMVPGPPTVEGGNGCGPSSQPFWVTLSTSPCRRVDH